MKTKAKPRPKTVAKAEKTPVRYSPALADLICERLADGESLNSICQGDDMPREASVRAWALDDVDGFSSKYTRAREIGYSRLAEEIIQIANTPVLGRKVVTKPITMRNSEGDTVDTGLVLEEVTEADMIEHRRLQVDTRKWMLSKVLPKIYGDKQQIEHSASPDLANALIAARRRSGRPES